MVGGLSGMVEAMTSGQTVNLEYQSRDTERSTKGRQKVS